METLRAKNLDEARKKLWDRYKTAYTIIDKRNVPKAGLFSSLFRREEIEVIYKVDTKYAYPEGSINPYGNPMNVVLSRENSINSVNSASSFNVLSGGAGALDSQTFEKNKAELLKKAGKNPSEAITNARLESQFSDLNKKLDEMTKIINEKQNASGALHPNIVKIQDLLSNNEFSFSYIQEITERIKKTFPLNELDDFDLLQRNVVDWIGESIKTGVPVNFRRPRVVIIIGPTGVGKTTTLVKLAAQFIKEEKSKGRSADFCFITTDTMRVGALEQLEKFGDIVGKKVIKAQNKDDVQKLYDQYKDNVDAIFIDTGGYGPNDAKHIAEMKETLSVQGLNPEIYLAVMASTKARDLHNIMQNYEPFGYQGVIVTKCDESSQYGNVISSLYERHKTLSYITHGQKITETLSRGNVISLLLRLEGFKIERTHVEDKFYNDDNSEE